jgi:hypothetical protein
MWNYFVDRLRIPIAQLNRETVQQELLARNVNAQIIAQWLHWLNDCEMALFAPDGGTDANQQFLERAKEVVRSIELALR